jgi:ABC-type lipoprotein release transport system permease subunit
VTFALVMVVLGAAAAISVAGPAWRAAHIDQALALRGNK